MIMRPETGTTPAVKPSFGAEFQPFLYGLIGDDPSGMPLSMLSVLARQDLDPWEQAGNWSRLPRPAATGELVAVIASLPPGLTSRPAPERIAERLIALLPSPRGMSSPWTPPSSWKLPSPQTPRPASAQGPTAGRKLSLIVFYISFLLLGQWVVMQMRAGAPMEKPTTAPTASAADPAPAPVAAVHPDRPVLF